MFEVEEDYVPPEKRVLRLKKSDDETDENSSSTPVIVDPSSPRITC